MTVHHVRCLVCNHEDVVDFSPMGWPKCPQCGAGSIHLVKLDVARMTADPDNPFHKRMAW
jgi:hypothetical protein